MAISFTRPDPSSPSAVASAAFTMSRKGFDQAEVREFLRMVAAELARLQERERFLERELRTSQRSTSPSSVALDDELVTKMLGEEAARILHTAREAGTQIKIRAEDGAARLLREATDEAQRVREEAELESSRRRHDASADAEAELEMAKQQGRDMVNEARTYRERVLNELARRREIARQQIEQLVHGRDRLLQAFERSRLVAVDVMAELTPLGEPTEYVDLSPTTGPVPLMVKNAPRPFSQQDDQPEVADDVPAVVFDHELDDGAVVDEIIVDEIIVEETVIEVVVDETGVDETDLDDDPVRLDIGPADMSQHDPADDDREPAPVVSLFGTIGEIDTPPADTPPAAAADDDPDATTMLSRASADDLFARLRAGRAAKVVKRATESIEVDLPTTDADQPASDSEIVVTAGAVVTTDGEPAEAQVDSVFAPTAAQPAAVIAVDDTPFARRDEALTPLIVAVARKLKRVLADEQNDVLHVLRGKEAVRTLDPLVAAESDHAARWTKAIHDELTAAAVAGALSMGVKVSAAQREVKKSDAVRAAGDLLASEVVQPLRTRLARCVTDADGDNAELATLVRTVYREWKTQRIDEMLDDVARMAFGRGALVGVAPGAKICWVVDPSGPQCPDAEDNALAGTISAGERFPTDHTCAPAHSGCRCMIVANAD
jgi:DivIVA domain-containing protein